MSAKVDKNSQQIKINLNASELAVAVGVNPYQNIRDLFIKIWSRYFPQDYYRLLDDIKKNNKVEIIQETEYQCLQRIANKYVSGDDKKKIDAEIRECLKAGDADALKKKQEEILKKIENDSKKSGVEMKAEDKQKLEKTLVSMSNKRFGTRKEKDAISQYEELTQKSVQRVGKYFTREINVETLTSTALFTERGGAIIWQFGGKIDGITKENELIEVKNRVKRFFNTIRDYEKVQIQTYFRLLDLESGFLVESLVKNKDSPPEINIVPVVFESDYWHSFLIPRTHRFIDFFQHMLFDDSYKMRLLMMDESTMEREIRDTLYPVELMN